MVDSRRLAAIFFSDIVGYSKMMSQNESETLELARENRETQKSLIEKYNGTWLKEMGDGTLAMFDTADDSVKCAIAIQKAIGAIGKYSLRIGIHLGDITIENNDVYGDGVNIASRIEGEADPGGIYISESVQKAILGRHEIETQDLGEFNLKNISYPVHVYAVKEDSLPKPSIRSTLLKRSKSLRYASVFIILIAIIVLFFNPYWDSNTDSKKSSIAVLPFDNLSNDPEQEYLVDGLHDAIIGKLAQIPDLRVISRTSTLQFKETTLPISEIAQQLNVNNVIEASVTEHNDKYLIQVQLIKAFPDESHIWSQEYEKGPEELLSMQGEVAKAVAESMNVDISNLSESGESENPEVYKLYLRGMHELDKGNTEDMLLGMKFLNEAVNLDPTAAFAYAGLAQGYVILGHSSLSKPEHFIKAKAAANQALKIDPNIAEAYAAMADVKMYNDWNYVEARRDFEKAVQLKPNLEVAHAHYTWLHVVYEDWDRAIYEGRLTTEIDPFSANYTGWLAWLYWWAGEYDEAIEWAEKALELNPRYYAGNMVLGCANAEKGNYETAIEALNKAIEITPRWVSHLAWVLQMSGNETEAQNLYNKWINDPRLTNRDLSHLNAVLGYDELSLDYLELMLDEQSRSIPWIYANPINRSLRSNPRFLEICRKANIPEEVLQKGYTIDREISSILD